MFNVTTGFGKSMKNHTFDDYGKAIDFLETTKHKRIKLGQEFMPKESVKSSTTKETNTTTTAIISRHW